MFVPKDIAKQRYEICKKCEYFSSLTKICKVCLCFMPAKTKLDFVSCPKLKWKKHYIPDYSTNEGKQQSNDWGNWGS